MQSVACIVNWQHQWLNCQIMIERRDVGEVGVNEYMNELYLDCNSPYD